MTESDRIPFKYGELAGVIASSFYKGGGLKSCMLNRENRIQTPAGPAIPQYRDPEFGERQKKHRSAMDFHPNGEIKSLALDKQMPLETPLGTIAAELITFYEDGSVNRIFPLNGLIDGYWSELNEREMAEVLELELPTGQIRAKVISLHFFPGGSVKSITVWPGEQLTVETPLGVVTGRAGLSFHENGALRSVEPAQVSLLKTPIGPIYAFDPDIIGMHADQNSVEFDAFGRLVAITSIRSGVKVIEPDGKETRIEPYEAKSFIDPSQMRTVPIKLKFSGKSIAVEAREKHVFSRETCRFETFERTRFLRATCESCPGENDPGCCQNGGTCSGCGGH